MLQRDYFNLEHGWAPTPRIASDSLPDANILGKRVRDISGRYCGVVDRLYIRPNSNIIDYFSVGSFSLLGGPKRFYVDAFDIKSIGNQFVTLLWSRKNLRGIRPLELAEDEVVEMNQQLPNPYYIF